MKHKSMNPSDLGKSPKPPARRSSGHDHRARRETVESIAIAVILAFLFRAFVAEAFVIPTGSMAPTLQGRHMDVQCAKCKYQYRAGASIENDRSGEVVATTCPICRFTMKLDKSADGNQRSFNGDRILVSKFSYEIGEPDRWDVIVFKYPGNAKQNYIKRLVGLPNETLRIRHGDIYRKPLRPGGQDDGDFQIVRKPPHKQRAMLQLVDDTRFVPQELEAVGWPPRWQDWSHLDRPGWRKSSAGEGFETTQTIADAENEVAWLRYRHVVPNARDWAQAAQGEVPQRLIDGQLRGQLITDFYEYNAAIQDAESEEMGSRIDFSSWKPNGMHWVGDLAVECEVEVGGDTGEVLLDLVKAGVHYQCRIDVATGIARLTIDGGAKEFTAAEGQPANTTASVEGTTSLRGRGKYRLLMANCDNQLLLWVDGRLIKFDGPTTYLADPQKRPQSSEQDAGDLEPAGIGAKGVELRVSRAKISRDVYYVAVDYSMRVDNDYEFDYHSEISGHSPRPDVDFFHEIFASPEKWQTTRLFDSRRSVEFTLGPDQFFPLGDNSPQSRDGRLWSSSFGFGDVYPPPYVRRDLLTGKALVIYWPHAWREPIPFLPNFERMGLIR